MIPFPLQWISPNLPVYLLVRYSPQKSGYCCRSDHIFTFSATFSYSPLFLVAAYFGKYRFNSVCCSSEFLQTTDNLAIQAVTKIAVHLQIEVVVQKVYRSVCEDKLGAPLVPAKGAVVVSIGTAPEERIAS